jgi:hypothetical protein
MNRSCPFSTQNLQFEGSAVEQAKCPLRTVRVGGNVGDETAALPQILLNLLGKPVEITRNQLQSYLSHLGIAATDIGGALDRGVSNYLNIVYPGQKLAARAAVPYWPVEEITRRADELFAQWGGIDMARRVAAPL